jgi:hypothetical protein
MTLREYFDHALRELYSLEELLESHGQYQMADVLRSVIEMSYSKLANVEAMVVRDVGQIEVQLDEYGEARQCSLTMKPDSESLH